MKHTFNWIVKTVLVSLVMVTFAASAAETNAFWVAALDLRAVEQDFAVARKDASLDGHPLSIGGKNF